MLTRALAFECDVAHMEVTFGIHFTLGMNASCLAMVSKSTIDRGFSFRPSKTGDRVSSLAIFSSPDRPHERQLPREQPAQEEHDGHVDHHLQHAITDDLPRLQPQ